MKNIEIAKILYNIADLLELQNIQFKPRAYRNAARGVENLAEDIAKVNLEEIPGVGKHIAAKIQEYLDTGKLKYYKKLKKEVKVDVEQLNLIPGMGPKKIKLLYEKLKIKNIQDLEKAIKKNKLQSLPGFKEKTVNNLLEGLELLNVQRFPYQEIVPIAEKIKKELSKHKAVKKIIIAGSYRRKKATIGDLDFLIVSSKPKEVMKAFISQDKVKKVLAQGVTKSSILLNNNLQIDLRVVKAIEYGAALLYFTGSKRHNIKLRKIALRLGYTLNEYGLYTLNKDKLIASKTEKEIYKKLGLKYVQPEERR